MKRRGIASILLTIALAAVAAGQATPQRVRVDQSAMSALIVKKVPPVYPPLARQARIQGLVLLQAQISKSGDVEDVQLISGHPMLAPAAMEAIKQWKYEPYQFNGVVVAVETNVSVNFTLAGGRPPAGTPGSTQGEIPAGVPAGIPFPQRVRVSQGVMQGLVVSKVQPEYPAEAKDQHIQGQVLLGANIDKEGNVYKVELISGHPLLAPAAMEAVRQWKYRPYLLNGIPVEVETTVTVNFTLEE